MSKYWDKDSEILFLGEWCKRYDKRNDWSNLNYKTVPFHWDNLQKRYRDFLYIRELTGRYLDQLTEILNTIHGTSLSKRSWRIIAGQWLRIFIEQVFDRYHCLEIAKSSFRINSTWITKSKIQEFTPKDMVGFYRNQGCEAYNLCLFSEIIRYQEDIPNIEKQRVIRTQRSNHGETSFKIMVKQKLNELRNCIASKNNKYFLYYTQMPLVDEIKLQISLGQFLNKQNINEQCIQTSEKTDNSMRQKIKLEATNEFEKFLSKILPLQIPMAYLENYHFLKEHSYQKLGEKPNIILTSSGHFNDELFKVWAANMVQKGTKLYIHQHGGHYGICKYSSSYEHEVAVSDKFFSWGWYDNSNKVNPAPGLRLLQTKKKKRLKESREILWVMSSVPVYSERMYSIPTGPQWLQYIQQQKTFYQNLDDAVKKRIVCRPFVHDYGWHERSRLQDNFPDLKFDNGRKNINKIRKNYSLIVETCNQTTFLESLSTNHPTVVFWDTTSWELSAAAKPYIAELQNAGIFFSDPIDIAEHINNISLNIDKWWAQPSIQNIRYKFCKQFAFRNDNWLKIWKQILVS